MRYWQVGFFVMWAVACGCCVLAEYWRRQWLKVQAQQDKARALLEESTKVVDYFMEHMLPIVAVIGYWPKTIDGPPQKLRDDAIKALQGAKGIGLQVEATVTTTKPTMH